MVLGFVMLQPFHFAELGGERCLSIPVNYFLFLLSAFSFEELEK